MKLKRNRHLKKKHSRVSAGDIIVILYSSVHLLEKTRFKSTHCIRHMPRHSTPLASVAHETILISETIPLLATKSTTGNIMRLAMTCHTLHLDVLGHLRKGIEESVQRPFRNQIIFEMYCLHNCAPNKTFFVPSLSPPKRGKVVVRCTYCLYSYCIPVQCLPSRICWIAPTHEVMIKNIMSRMGARHAWLTE